MQPYTIKDVASRSGQSIHTIKFYLKLGLIRERGQSAVTRFRFFDETTLTQLAAIRALRKQGKHLSDIKQLLMESQSGTRAQWS